MEAYRVGYGGAVTNQDWLAPLIAKATAEGRDTISITEMPPGATMFDLAALMVAHPEVIPKIEMRSMTLPKGTKQAEPAASSEPVCRICDHAERYHYQWREAKPTGFNGEWICDRCVNPNGKSIMNTDRLRSLTHEFEPAASSEQAEPTHTHPPPAPPPADLDPDFFIRSAPFRPPAVRRIQTPEDVQEMVDKLYDTIYDTGRDRGFVRGFAYGTTIAIIITVLLLW